MQGSPYSGEESTGTAYPAIRALQARGTPPHVGTRRLYEKHLFRVGTSRLPQMRSHRTLRCQTGALKKPGSKHCSGREVCHSMRFSRPSLPQIGMRPTRLAINHRLVQSPRQSLEAKTHDPQATHSHAGRSFPSTRTLYTPDCFYRNTTADS